MSSSVFIVRYDSLGMADVPEELPIIFNLVDIGKSVF